MRVGLFDSGIGGLTVLKTLLKKYPNNEYIYYGDTLNVPYGNKSKEELFELSKNNMNFLISKNVDIIIIACGTVSSNCLDYLKSNYDIPIYSIVTPTIDYLNNSNYSNIGVIATNATINSHIFKNSIINKNVFEIAAPRLVELIENNNSEEIDIYLNDLLKDYIGKIDSLVLGCTHYPIVVDNIKRIIDIPLINMSDYLEIEDGSNKKVEIYFSRLDENIKKNADMILNS